jgi:hypothetical protein
MLSQLRTKAILMHHHLAYLLAMRDLSLRIMMRAIERKIMRGLVIVYRSRVD